MPGPLSPTIPPRHDHGHYIASRLARVADPDFRVDLRYLHFLVSPARRFSTTSTTLIASTNSVHSISTLLPLLGIGYLFPFSSKLIYLPWLLTLFFGGPRFFCVDRAWLHRKETTTLFSSRWTGVSLFLGRISTCPHCVTVVEHWTWFGSSRRILLLWSTLATFLRHITSIWTSFSSASVFQPLVYLFYFF